MLKKKKTTQQKNIASLLSIIIFKLYHSQPPHHHVPPPKLMLLIASAQTQLWVIAVTPCQEVLCSSPYALSVLADMGETCRLISIQKQTTLRQQLYVCNKQVLYVILELS